jgi:UV DNA damage endonuclease
MHPDQFIVINAKDDAIIQRSIRELSYHAELLDLLQLDRTAKIQLHIGGVYGDKSASIERFINNYHRLPETITRRLVIENDHSRYHLQDCLRLSNKLSIPILFDYFHHQIHHSRENLQQALADFVHTWTPKDGIPLCDYSSQQPQLPLGSHAHSIDLADFRHFLELTTLYDIDIMLEVKDKEHSAHKAIAIAKNDNRFFTVN